LTKLQGAGLSGLLVRGNAIQAPQVLQWGNGQNNVTSVLEECKNAAQLGGIWGLVIPLPPAVLFETVNYQ
jgi:hypothetical protein